jgi:hypothetical protein
MMDSSREVKDTNTKLRMTDAGNMMVNEELEVHGRKLNEIGETRDGANQRRRDLLKYTSEHNESKNQMKKGNSHSR